jgi:hypothetical protein
MVPFGRLLATLGDIPDPRRAQGKRYGLSHLPLFSVLAVLAGATSYQGIITFIGVHRERLNHVFGSRFRRAPALNTLRNLLLALDLADLKAAFRRHARDLDRAGPETGLRRIAACSAAVRCFASARLSPRSARLACASRSMRASSISVVTPDCRSATSFTRHSSFDTAHPRPVSPHPNPIASGPYNSARSPAVIGGGRGGSTSRR